MNYYLGIITISNKHNKYWFQKPWEDSWNELIKAENIEVAQKKLTKQAKQRYPKMYSSAWVIKTIE